MIQQFSGRGGALGRVLLLMLAAAVLAALALALVSSAKAQTPTPTVINPNARLWVQKLDADGNPVDLSRDHWSHPYTNRFTPNTSTLKVRVYMLKDAYTGATAPDASQYAAWDDFSGAWLTLKTASAGNLFANPLTTGTLQDKDGTDLPGNTAHQKSISPATWHMNTDGYVAGSATPTGNTAVPPIDITISFSPALSARNFFLFTRKNCNNACVGSTFGDIQYEWKLPTRSTDIGWGLFARLNGATPPAPVVDANGNAAVNDMHYFDTTSANTTITVRFYVKQTDADNPALRPSSPSVPDATYAHYKYESSVRLYTPDNAQRGNMTGVRYYNPGTTTRWAGCRSGGPVHECYINKTSLKAAAMLDSQVTSSDVEETDTVIPVDFDIVVPLTDLGDRPSAFFFARGGTDADLESGGNRWPFGLGLIKRPVFSLHNRRNTYDQAESTCSHGYPTSGLAQSPNAEQQAVITSDTSGGSLAHNCADLSVAPGQSVFIGYWAGFGGSATHPQEYFWNRGDKNRVFGYQNANGMRFREIDYITVSSGGAGLLGISTRCPSHRYFDAPEDHFYDAGWPKDRTREGMGTCSTTTVAWVGGDTDRANGTEHAGPAGLGYFTPYPDASDGTVTLTATAYGTDRDGDGDADWTATDTLDITVNSTKVTVSASDTFTTGETDNSPLAARLIRSDHNGLIALTVGRLERHAFPIFPWKPESRSGGSPYATPAELAADTNNELAWAEGRSFFGDDDGAALSGAYLGPVLFSDLAEDEAVRVTVDRGVVSHEGEACTAGAGGCTLSLSRAELMTSSGRGVSGAVGTNANDPFVISYLDYMPAGSGEVTFTLQAFPADNSWPRAAATSFTETVPALDAIRTRGLLHQDADGLLSPGDTAAVTIGIEGGGPIGSSSGSAVSRLILGDRIYQALAIDGLGRLTSYTREITNAPRELGSGSYLVISGPATWTDNGGKRLSIGSGADFGQLLCTATQRADSSVEADAGADSNTCYVTDGSGARPKFTVDSDAANGAEIRVSGSFVAGVNGFTIAHWPWEVSEYPRAYRLATSAFGTATFNVRDVQQLSSITLGRKPDPDDGSVPEGPVPIGSKSAEVRLALLNEDGNASSISAVSAITITVIGGGTLTGQGCTEAASCTIQGDSGFLYDAVQDDPSKTAKIDLTFNAPNTPGSSSIDAAVVGIDGSTFAATLALTVSGSATELAVGGDMPRVHSSATANDDRDKILIPITARDDNGNDARMPPNAAATVRGIDGAVVPSSSLTSEVKCEGGNDEPRRRCNVEIVVTAPSSQPLASGAYTATITGSGIGSSEAGFAVAGPAEKVSISIPDELPGVGQPFSATVSVVDKDDIPVADGTWVVFETTGTGAGAKTAIIGNPPETDVDHDGDAETATVKQRRAKTKNGEAGASVIVVRNGIAILTASVGDKSDNAPLDTRVSTGAAEDGAAVPVIIEYDSADGEPASSTWAVYRGSAAISADEALSAGPPSARIVWLWNGVTWIRYAESDGQELPGSLRFTITDGDIVWFGE